ncbi:hypothetical protein ACFWZW_09155 [Microbacterium enclense]
MDMITAGIPFGPDDVETVALVDDPLTPVRRSPVDVARRAHETAAD